jgi:hypothetical protein
MAFNVIPEPDMEKANLDEWRVMIQDLQAFSLGLLSVEIENMDTGGVPRVRGVIGVNGRMFRKDGFDSVSGSPAADAYNFIYAVRSENNENEVLLVCSSEVPVWSAGKGGWYNGNKRAIARFIYSGGNYYDKVILDNYNAMYNFMIRDGVTTGGTPVSIPDYVANKKNTYRFYLPAGAYRYSLSSGAGAGDGGAGSGATGGAGGVAATRNTGTGTFVWRGGNITIRIGGDGCNGGNGGNCGSTLSGATPGY